jgi:hypothetical protein
MYNFKSKKGMKFNKLTHLSIIVVLAILFIVVYLYYTIRDVKKIHSEVTKLTSDITEMNRSISSITTAILPMVSSPQVGGVCQMPQSQPQPQQSKPSMQMQQTVEDDESSVNSQELKTIMETIEDEDKSIVVQETPSVPVYVNDVANLDDLKDVEELMAEQQQTLKDAPRTLDITSLGELSSHTESIDDDVDLSALSLDEIKKISYNQLRRYCKNHGINNKGTADVLIYRIKGITA